MLPFTFLMLAACSAGGRVAITGPIFKAEEKPVLSVEQALSSLDASGQSSGTSYDADLAAAEKIRSQAGIHFDWSAFWETLEARPTRKVGPPILQLHEIACDSRSFRSFASFVISRLEGLDYLAGDRCRCEVSIGKELTLQALKKLSAALSTQPTSESSKYAAKWVTRLLSQEYARNPSLDWTNVIQTLTPAQWKRIADSLYDSGANAEYLQLLNVHQDTGGSTAHLVSKLAKITFKDDVSFQTVKSHLGYTSLLNAVLLAPAEFLGSVQDPTQMKVLNLLETGFRPEETPGDSDARRFEVWSQYKSLLKIEDAIGVRSTRRSHFTALLTWRETLQRKLEKDWSASPEEAISFLKEFAPDDLDSIWLRLRLSHGQKRTELASAFRDGFPTAPLTPLGRVLWHRLNARFSETETVLQKNLAIFCDMLAEEGITPSHFAAGDLSLLAGSKLTPGCYTGMPASPTPVVLEKEAIQMPFDSVLFLPEYRLKIRTQKFDGSFINLSAVTRLMDLPAETLSHPQPDAVALPVILGYKLTRPIGLLKPGVHFFLAHLTLQPAAAGTAAATQASDGLPGGTLAIETDSSQNSFEPRILSLGGPGQLGAPQVLGGRGDQSHIDAADISRTFQDLDLTGRKAAQGEKPYFIAHPTLLKLKMLRQNAELTLDGKPKKFTLMPDEYAALAPDMFLKMQKFCATFLSLEKCLESALIPQAQQLVDTLLEKNRELENDEQLPEFQNEPFQVPAGAAGPLNPPGNTGPNGKISLRDFYE
ncbi:MAG: hypothetical protein H7222_12110 [Methylotenera sp.]|nr:hypothetical protein [Oligoflexia bacterium]